MDNLNKEEKFRKYAKQMTLSFAGVYEKDNCLYDIETSRGLSLDGKRWRKQGSGNLIEYSDYISIESGLSALKTHLIIKRDERNVCELSITWAKGVPIRIYCSAAKTQYYLKDNVFDFKDAIVRFLITDEGDINYYINAGKGDSYYGQSDRFYSRIFGVNNNNCTITDIRNIKNMDNDVTRSITFQNGELITSKNDKIKKIELPDDITPIDVSQRFIKFAKSNQELYFIYETLEESLPGIKTFLQANYANWLHDLNKADIQYEDWFRKISDNLSFFKDIKEKKHIKGMKK